MNQINKASFEETAVNASNLKLINKENFSDEKLAEYLVNTAGGMIQKFYTIWKECKENEQKRLAPYISKRADLKSHYWLTRQLKEHRPNDSILSEEAEDDLNRLNSKRVWIIDPLDGSYQFGKGLNEYAIQVGLWTKDKAIAAVWKPNSSNEYGYTYSTGEKTNSLDINLPEKPEPYIMVSSTRKVEVAKKVSEQMKIGLKKMGSCGIKTIEVINNRAIGYIHQGNMHEWDSFAPVQVAKSYGLSCTDFNGNELEFNKPEPVTTELVVCRPEYRDQILAAINN